MSVPRAVKASIAELRSMPPYLGCMVGGGVLAGTIGGITGLLVGLTGHPATAWFAVFEAAVPAALVGTVIGLTVGLGWTGWRCVKRRLKRPPPS